MYTVHILYEGRKGRALKLKGAEEGQTLLEFLLANKIPVRSDCGGVCHCATCHIEVKKGASFIEEASRRELDFLSRVAKRKGAWRLACQCLLVSGSGEIEIALPAPQ